MTFLASGPDRHSCPQPSLQAAGSSLDPQAVSFSPHSGPAPALEADAAPSSTRKQRRRRHCHPSRALGPAPSPTVRPDDWPVSLPWSEGCTRAQLEIRVRRLDAQVSQGADREDLLARVFCWCEGIPDHASAVAIFRLAIISALRC